MFSTPLICDRAISGMQTIASGSIGVPGTKRTRGSRCAWFTSAASRLRAAQPVIPSSKRMVVRMIWSAHWSRASTGTSSPCGSSASQMVSVSCGIRSVSVSAMRTSSASRLSSASTSWKTSASRRYDSTSSSAAGTATDVLRQQPEVR